MKATEKDTVWLIGFPRNDGVRASWFKKRHVGPGICHILSKRNQSMFDGRFVVFYPNHEVLSLPHTPREAAVLAQSLHLHHTGGRLTRDEVAKQAKEFLHHSRADTEFWRPVADAVARVLDLALQRRAADDPLYTIIFLPAVEPQDPIEKKLWRQWLHSNLHLAHKEQPIHATAFGESFILGGYRDYLVRDRISDSLLSAIPQFDTFTGDPAHRSLIWDTGRLWNSTPTAIVDPGVSFEHDCLCTNAQGEPIAPVITISNSHLAILPAIDNVTGFVNEVLERFFDLLCKRSEAFQTSRRRVPSRPVPETEAVPSTSLSVCADADVEQGRQKKVQIDEHVKRLGYENPLIGESPALLRIYSEIYRAFREKSAAVLVYGEVGSGKEVLCELLTRLGRDPNSMLSYNACALTDQMASCDLFGVKDRAVEILSRVVDEFFRGYPFRCMITPPSA